MRIQTKILEALEFFLPALRRIINPSVLDFSVKRRDPRLEPHDIKQPSSFLHDAEWVTNMTVSISGRAAAFSITEAHIAQADALVRASRVAHISQSQSGSSTALVREVDQREYWSDVYSQHVAWASPAQNSPRSSCLGVFTDTAVGQIR